MELLTFLSEHGGQLAKLLGEGGSALVAIGFAFLYFKIDDLRKIVTNGLSHRVQETHDNVIELKAKLGAIETITTREKNND